MSPNILKMVCETNIYSYEQREACWDGDLETADALALDSKGLQFKTKYSGLCTDSDSFVHINSFSTLLSFYMQPCIPRLINMCPDMSSIMSKFVLLDLLDQHFTFWRQNNISPAAVGLFLNFPEGVGAAIFSA